MILLLLFQTVFQDGAWYNMHIVHPIITYQTTLVDVNTAFINLASILSTAEGTDYKVTACFETVNSRNKASDVNQITYQIYSSWSGVEAQGQGYISNINPENSYNSCTLTASIALPPGGAIYLRCACTETGVMQARVVYTLERWALT